MDDLDELLTHLENSSRLNRGEARRLVEDVLGFFHETPDAYVVRRHAELQRMQVSNTDIFERIAGELEQRRFAAQRLSTRQIRRIIYG